MKHVAYSLNVSVCCTFTVYVSKKCLDPTAEVNDCLPALVWPFAIAVLKIAPRQTNSCNRNIVF